MRAHPLRILALSSLPLFVACAADPERSGPAVRIEVAPLTLPNVEGIEYALAVLNAAPAGQLFDVGGNVVGTANLASLVWQEPSVTSNQFGNLGGGDISYVGPCDATSGTNWAAVALKQIDVGQGGSYDGAAPFSGSDNVLDDENSAASSAPGSADGDPDFVNPCDYLAPCVLALDCVENRDTPVVFNLTIMRDAEQGFFDVAVNFEDVFCSAKFDSCDDVTATTLQVNGQTFHAYTFESEAFWAWWFATADTPYWRVYRPDAGGGVGEHFADYYPPANTGPEPPAVLMGNPVNLTAAVPSGTPITLLFGADGVIRQHTAIAALACTVGPDTATVALETELLLTTPTVTCGATTFALPLDGLAAGDHQVMAGEKTLRYAVYFGAEELDCGQGPRSCNKVYYNIAINIADLATQDLFGCTLGYGASAIETGDDATFDDAGALADPAAQYGAVGFGLGASALPLTGASGASCVSHPLSGEGSLVRPIYIKGADYGDTTLTGFDFYSDGGAARTFPRRFTAIAQSPLDGATGVALDAAISVDFGRPMDPATINTATFTLRMAGHTDAVGAEVDNVAGLATLTPTAPLVAGTTYVAAIVGGAAIGGAVAQAIEWTFTTVDPPPALPPLRVFVMGLESFGNFGAGVGGFTVADQYCTSSAADASLGGSWKAWLSIGTSGPADRFTAKTIGTTRAFALLDGTLIASDWTDLTDGALRHAIDRTSSGGAAPASVWTNTNPDGTPFDSDGAAACAGFTSTAFPAARIGHTDLAGAGWTSSTTLTCVNVAAFYCFEQAL